VVGVGIAVAIWWSTSGAARWTKRSSRTGSETGSSPSSPPDPRADRERGGLRLVGRRQL